MMRAPPAKNKKLMIGDPGKGGLLSAVERPSSRNLRAPRMDTALPWAANSRGGIDTPGARR
jgi:hypothetical protein